MAPLVTLGPRAPLFALAGGSGWAASPLPERRARSVLARLGAAALPAARPAWTPAVTHVVTPGFSRSLLCVCGAAAGAEFVTPAYIAACDAADALLDPAGFAPDASAPRTPRLWPGAAGFWRAAGPPLRAHRVAILGELCPPGATVLDSATVEVMLRAAGAVLVAVGETPTFALAPAMIAGDDPDLRTCVDASVPCLGAAFVPDLLACAQLNVVEYLSVGSQRELVVPTISTQSYDGLLQGEAVAITRGALATLEAAKVQRANSRATKDAGESDSIAVEGTRSPRARGRRRRACHALYPPPPDCTVPVAAVGGESMSAAHPKLVSAATATISVERELDKCDDGGNEVNLAALNVLASGAQARGLGVARLPTKRNKRKIISVTNDTPLVATRRSKRECRSVYASGEHQSKVSRREEKSAPEVTDLHAGVETGGRDFIPADRTQKCSGYAVSGEGYSESQLKMAVAPATENEGKDRGVIVANALQAPVAQTSAAQASTAQTSSPQEAAAAQEPRAKASGLEASGAQKFTAPGCTLEAPAEEVLASTAPAVKAPTVQVSGKGAVVSDVAVACAVEVLEAGNFVSGPPEASGVPCSGEKSAGQCVSLSTRPEPCPLSPSILVRSRKRRRAPVIAESPPSDDDDDRSGGVDVEKVEDVDSYRVSSDAEDDALIRPVFTSRGASQRRGSYQQSSSVAPSATQKLKIDSDQTEHTAPALSYSPPAAPKSLPPASVHFVPNRHRIRLRTPASAPAEKVSSPKNVLSDVASRKSDDDRAGILTMQNLDDEVIALESSPEKAPPKTADRMRSVSRNRGSDSQDDSDASDDASGDAHSALSLPRGNSKFALPEFASGAAMAFVMAAIGGKASKTEVELLRVKNRDAAAEAALLEKNADAERAAVAAGICDFERGGGGFVDVEDVAVQEGLFRQETQNCTGAAEASKSIGLDAQAEQAVRFPVVSSSLLLPPIFPAMSNGIDSVGERCLGVAVDDDLLEGEIDSLLWVMAAERVCGVGGMKNRVSHSRLPSALSRQACLLLAESAIMQKLFSSTCTLSLVDTFATTIGGYCGRLLELDPPEDVIVKFAAEMMDVRELQLQEADIDSLHVLLTSTRLPPLKRRHHIMAILWVQLLKLCEKSPHTASFWSVFDKVAASLRFAKFSEAGQRLHVSGSGAFSQGNGPRSYSVPKARPLMTDWEDWSLRAATAFGSLHCVELYERPYEQLASPNRYVDPAGAAVSTVVGAQPVPARFPNWKLLNSLLLEMKGEVSSASGGNGDGALVAGKRLFELLYQIVVDVACQLWPADEDILLSATDAVHTFYRSWAISCECANVPEFLLRLRGRNDPLSRRLFLSSQLKTPCDCLVALSWLYFTDSRQQVSAKMAGRIVSLSSSLVRGAGSSGFRHAISLILATGDAISPPSSDTGSKEKIFCSLLFSKAPSLNKALSLSSAIGFEERSRWFTLLEAALLRSRIVASSGKSFTCYVEIASSSFAQAVRILERPEAAAKESVATMEANRVQHSLVLEISVQLLDTVRELVNIALGLLASDERDECISLALLDSIFVASIGMVAQSGKLMQGILSQLRLSPAASSSSISRRGILVSSVRTLHSLVNLAATVVGLATRGACLGPWKDSLPGLQRFLASVEACSLTAVVDIVHKGVVLDSTQEAEETRLLSVTTLARLIGLRCLVFPGLSSGDRALAPATIVQRCGMDFWSAARLAPRELHRPSVKPNSKPKPLQPSSQQPKRGRRMPISTVVRPGPKQAQPVRCGERRTLALPVTPITREGRAMMATFWSHLVDSLWSSAVLESDPSLEKMVIAVWILLLSAPEVVNNCQPVLSLAWSLKAACSRRPVIASFFRETLLHDRMVESDPGLSFVVVKVRPETVAAALAVCVGTSGFFTAEKLCILIDTLSLVVSQGGFDLSNPAWKCVSTASDVTRSLPPLQCSLIHSAFAADLSALLFAVRGALGRRLVSPRGSANECADAGCRVLEKVSEALSHIANVAGRCSDEADLSSMYGRVAAFVLHGTACVGSDSRSVELRVRFTRFARVLGSTSFQDLMVPVRHLALPTWLLHLGLPVPYRPGPAGESPAAQHLLRSRQSAGEQWRTRALHSLVHDPLTVTAFGTPVYRQATERLLAVLVVHEQVGSSAAEVARDVQGAVSKIVASLPSSSSDNVHDGREGGGGGQSGVTTTIDICQQVGFKVEAMFSDSADRAAGDQAHARALAGLGTVLIAESTAILMGDAF